MKILRTARLGSTFTGSYKKNRVIVNGYQRHYSKTFFAKIIRLKSLTGFLNLSSSNPTKWANTPEEFVSNSRRIV